MVTDIASDTVRLFIALWPTPAFRPHVTLARHATAGIPPTHGATLSWPVHGYALMQSAAGRYTPIARYR